MLSQRHKCCYSAVKVDPNAVIQFVHLRETSLRTVNFCSL
ncbi:hypothetical protein SAMN05421666_2660 [Roseovarius nanhaiticus]|uniref:Uncharacterized protein n=1 Tax=Roseovarius nanhaiticus TaxID=573024 RepID=A0A1N7H7Y8_9RHOB|nr:hypothetical protein SAMN05216208_2659 [Roseovarius nanhaiticus]SIS20966.1 hypothetical protein SAMN05421666_2660 [Roseovarius nanhaiticus]